MKKLTTSALLQGATHKLSSRAPRSGAWRSRSSEIASLTTFARNDGHLFQPCLWERCFAMASVIAVVLLLSKAAFAGTVTGKVNFTGTAPQMAPISMNADPVCASLHTTPAYEETVIVNDNKTLKNVFVYVKEGLEGKTFPNPTMPVTIDQKGCQYTPHVFGIQAGQTLEIVNSDSTLHNIHSLAEKNKQFNFGMPLQGMKLTKKFDTPEVMAKFKCDVHPWMNAYIGVLTHPYFSATGTNGAYEIKDLPAGEYTIEAWHEKYGTQTQKVTVGEGSATADFTFNG